MWWIIGGTGAGGDMGNYFKAVAALLLTCGFLAVLFSLLTQFVFARSHAIEIAALVGSVLWVCLVSPLLVGVVCKLIQDYMVKP